jgi:hypothetical protein
VPNRRESAGRPATDALGWRIGRDKLRMFAFEALKLPEELVELGVGYLGVAVSVVALFVMTDLRAEVCDAGGRVHDEQVLGSTFRVLGRRFRRT